MAKSNLPKRYSPGQAPKICIVDGCETKSKTRGYCGKHYAQILKFGHIRSRTQRDKNEIVIRDGLAYIYLYNAEQEIIAKTVIDANVVDCVRQYKWHLSAYGYAQSSTLKPTLSLSRFLMEPVPEGMEVDHINRDTLDNRMSNLRYATKSQNSTNSIYKNTMGFRGVNWIERLKKWRARIKHRGVEIYIGIFDSEADAARAYNENALELHGEFATLNKV